MTGTKMADVDAEGNRIRAAYARRKADDRYSWFNDAHLLAVQERERHTLALLRRHGFGSLDTARILELGCGTGFWLREMIKWGARPEHVTGIELLPDRVAEARQLCPAGVTITCGNAANVAVEQHSYNIVLQSMVLTSVLDPKVRQAVAYAMMDALDSGGLILWYDYHVNNPRNPDVRGVKRAEIRSLFPGCRIELRRVTLAAPLARRVLPWSTTLHDVLHALPFLRTHYLGVIKRA